jgi:hypothetical protein
MVLTPHARFARSLLLTIIVVAAGVVALGWFTGVRRVMHGALLSLAVGAFLPFVVVAAGIALSLLVVVLGLLAALLAEGGVEVPHDAGASVGELGLRLVGPYYRFLARRRHPVFWGVPIGALAGGLGLWALLATIVLPGEARSAVAIAGAQADVERCYARTSRYPEPTPEGHLLRRDLDPAAGEGAVRDGFGRPLRYEKRGRWKVASYRLRSDGFDGRPGGGDDLCRSGVTRLGRLAEAVRVSRTPGGLGVSVGVRLGAVREMRCPD